MPNTRVPSQSWILAIGLLLWSVWPTGELWALVAGYGGAWLVLQIRARRPIEVPFGDRLWLFVALALVAIPAASLYRSLADLADNEGLVGLDLHTRDRLRLENTPSIAPPLVATDHPQTFYVSAPGSESLRVILGQGGPSLEGDAMADGLFVVTYDPRRYGLPTGTRAMLDIYVESDGRRVKRRVRRVDPEPHPRWFCSDPDAGWAAAPSEETDELIVLSRDGVMERVPTADGPTDCAFFVDADGRRLLAISHRYDPELWILDAEDFTQKARLRLGTFQNRMAVDRERRRLAVASAGVEPALLVIDGAGGAEPSVERIPLDVLPDWIAFGATADELALSSAHDRTLCRFRRDPDTGEWVDEEHLWLGRPVVTMAPSVGGERLFVAVTDYRPDGEDHRGNHFIQDQILTVDFDSWEVTSRGLTHRRTGVQNYPGSIDSGTSPMGLVHRQDGTLLIAFAGSEEVWQVDDGLRLPAVVTRGLDLDLITPHGVADLGDGVWAASSPVGGALALYDENGMRSFHGVARKDGELASAPAGSLARQALTLRRGERAFYETTRSGVSCQGCHLHGDSDHSPHDIGQTPLLTTLTVRGLTGTSPYLRDGSFPRIQDLHPDLAEFLLHGYRRESAGRAEDLESYVESLPRLVNPAQLAGSEPFGPDLNALREGYGVYVQARCDLCHTPPAFTNLSGHPVRGLFPEYGAGLGATVFLDTPSLIGTGPKGHWLQDGRAATLESLLVEHNQSNRHGDTLGLSGDEVSALAELLRQL